MTVKLGWQPPREIRTRVQPVLVEMQCPNCTDGRMVADGDKDYYGWQYHHCNKCYKPEAYDETYPRIEYEEIKDDENGGNNPSAPETVL